jgi:predicted transcriptional regulator of viral defense system
MRITILEELAKKGNTFTVEHVLSATNIQKEVLWVILSRLEKKGWIERIEKGKYIIIPLGAEKGKYTLNEFVIGSLLVNPYCVAYWSALNFYGLTEQIPNTVFLQTTSRKKKQVTEIFGVRYRIIRIKEEKFFAIRKEWIEHTQVNITNKEKTIIDCLDKPQYCGGIVEVAKALRYGGELNKKKILDYAQKLNNSGVIRRLGYLCDLFGIDIGIPEIKTRNYLLLDPTMPHEGTKNAKWRLIINLGEKIMGDLE